MWLYNKGCKGSKNLSFSKGVLFKVVLVVLLVVIFFF